MKACIIHNTLNSVGGGEHVCLAVIETLKELGYEVTLITLEPTDWNKIKKIVGLKKLIKPDREKYLVPFRIGAFGIYMRLLTPLKSLRGKWDLKINTHGDITPFTYDDIIYMHYPVFALLKDNSTKVKYSESLFWRTYFIPYQRIQERLAKRLKYKVLLTNSEYSASVIKKYVGIDAIVLHPPVEIEDFLKSSLINNREDAVILCGRFSPEKNYELALEIANELPEIDFRIIGASSGKISEGYYRKLVKLVEEKGLKNVNFFKDAPRKLQLELYSRSKVFLHTMVGEHFGIAVVEGMAAGLVPVVHKSGGPWNDILMRGKYGLGYSSVTEAAEAIEKAIREYQKFRTIALERARMFSKDEFKSRFRKIVAYFFTSCFKSKTTF